MHKRVIFQTNCLLYPINLPFHPWRTSQTFSGRIHVTHKIENTKDQCLDDQSQWIRTWSANSSCHLQRQQLTKVHLLFIRWLIMNILSQVSSQPKKLTLDDTLEAEVSISGKDKGTSKHKLVGLNWKYAFLKYLPHQLSTRVDYKLIKDYDFKCMCVCVCVYTTYSDLSTALWSAVRLPSVPPPFF